MFGKTRCYLITITKSRNRASCIHHIGTMRSQGQMQQETPNKSSFCNSMIFVVALFGFPIPFVLLISFLHRLRLSSHYSFDTVFLGYSLLIITFVKLATTIIRWTAQAIVAKTETEGTFAYMMSPLLWVAFPQWILFLATIMTVLDSDDKGVETNSGYILCEVLITIFMPVLAITQAFRKAMKTIDAEHERQVGIQKQGAHTQRFIKLTREAHRKKFNGVTSCLKLL